MKIEDKYQLPLFILLVVGLVALRLVTKTGIPGIVLENLILAILIFTAFQFRNNHKKYLKSSAASISIIPVYSLLLSSISLPSKIKTALVGIFALWCVFVYCLRFASKPNKWTLLEIVKIAAVIQFILLYSFDTIQYGKASTLILGITFVSTRLLQLKNTPKMARNSLSVILMLITIFFIVYSKIKADEASAQSMIAHENYKEIQMMKSVIISMETKLDSIQQQLNKCQSDKD